MPVLNLKNWVFFYFNVVLEEPRVFHQCYMKLQSQQAQYMHANLHSAYVVMEVKLHLTFTK